MYRIIPARAGFTRLRTKMREIMPDHPRSRGVYQESGEADQFPRGSSPLARGLRTFGLGAHPPAGIIPARAGFTVHRHSSSPPIMDHPRSRGVYATTTWTAVIIPGSSPLARGLLGRLRRLRQVRRIIPARAGFTWIPELTVLLMLDHPRSRGVYAAAEMSADSSYGSSPLARGLPFLPSFLPSSRGIIPARAGFTPGGG